MILLRPRTTGIPTALSTLALAACLVVPAGAQEISGLRGTTAEQDIITPEAASPTPATPLSARRQIIATDDTPEPPAQARALPVTAEFADEAPEGRQNADNLRVGSIEGQPTRSRDDAFAAPGIRAGTFVLRPRLEQGIGWTSNATAAPNGSNAVFSETRLRLDAQSDWARHAATIGADLNWRKSLSGSRINEVEGGINGRLDLELANELSAFAAAGYRAAPESASTPGAIAASVSQPLRHTLDANAGLSRDAGLLRLGLTGALSREIFDDAKLANGASVSQRERDSTLATARLRIGYAASAALTPFVELEAGRRFHDLKHDSAGYARSADRYGLRGGIALDFGEKLAGEISAGWLTERPDDSRLDPVSGLSLAGNLEWSPVRGTIVGFEAATQVEGASGPGTGSLLYSGSLRLQRQLRANLTGEVSAGMDWRDYSAGGHDLVLRGEANLTWWLNRYAGVTTRARHEKQTSTLAGRDYDATSFWLGMTLQR